jgi:hypothetical protein
VKTSFQHILLTRFNVRVFGSHGLDPDWLAHRFRFFERICFPSVQAQTTRDFHWILFCDSATPDWALARLRTLLGAEDKISLAFIDGPVNAENRHAAIAAVLRPGVTHLVTSRLDNDDGLACRFMETVQAQFASQDFEFLNMPDGHTCFRGRIYAWRHPSNPFLSLVERIGGPHDPFKTVLCVPHHEAEARHPVRQVACGPAWLQSVHGRNVSNLVRGSARPVEDLRPWYSADVVAAVADAAGLWGARETWDYWVRRIVKKVWRGAAVGSRRQAGASGPREIRDQLPQP